MTDIADPTCTHIGDQNHECGADGTIFVVFEADLLSTEPRLVQPDHGFVAACPTHLVAALTAADGSHNRLFVVLPVAEADQ